MNPISRIGEVKTQPIYHVAAFYEEYELSNLSNSSGILDNFLIGKGIPLNLPTLKNADSFSYESFIEGSSRFDHTGFLENALSLGFSLLDGKGYRKPFSEDNCTPLIDFTEKYGLNRIDIYLPDIGCSATKLYSQLQTLVIAYERLYGVYLQKKEFKGHVEVDAMLCSASIISRCLYSKEKKRFYTVLQAESLIDIAYFQLSTVFSEGVFTRKCANAACVNVIIGGRSDRLTCSDSCRKALQRSRRPKEI